MRVSTGFIDWGGSAEFYADETVTGDFFAMVGETVALEVRRDAGAGERIEPRHTSRRRDRNGL
jgi:hypothetical protein